MRYPDGSSGFELRRELRKEFPERYEEPNVEGSWGSYGDYRLVGNGSVTNRFCGRFLAFKGCARTELHDRVTLNGVDYRGKVYVRKVHHFCNKPSCPVCYKYGWAVRGAGSIEGRLLEASQLFGHVEHMVCSVPSVDYGLNYRYLRKKVVKVLSGLGVVGGVLIFHAFRYNKQRHWYWSPHFHVLGYIAGGYGKCRHCKGGDCYACGGFEGKTYKCYRENGYIVRVFGERKTIFGTAWYQLHHSSYKVGVKRFHIATWFGVCSYRKLKVTVEKRKELCPICQHDLENLDYFGRKEFVTDSRSSDYKRSSFEDAFENGVKVWGESVSGEPKRWMFSHGSWC